MGKKEEMNLVEEQSMHMPIRRGNQHLKPSSLQKRDVVVIVDSLLLLYQYIPYRHHGTHPRNIS